MRYFLCVYGRVRSVFILNFFKILTVILVTPVLKVKVDSILFCMGDLVLFDFVFVQLSYSYRLYELVLSFCYQCIIIITTG